ncbi:hypothetical protein [Staphylococcus haemolyticus]|uniref:hypothetical protein n=1 Tax=Staphylococcus haemolyticus TaxID=1283 RepID=UPI00069D15B7|nr:hypothetical protein [Staphylococcus haemolyticus]PTK74362.1 hypothetical protein BUZ29_01440 [Staphylococcus haemolyticus]PTL13174.1 hypothetical protein BUZ23_01875 [Staphylococcus haemolyticus]RIO61331.1 hypothetical protein BUZ42_02905 [Staphylococcus haemolyticus]
MNELQESTLKDLALCIKASQTIKEQESIIKAENGNISYGVIKNIRNNLLLTRLIPAILFSCLFFYFSYNFLYLLIAISFYVVYYFGLKKYSVYNRETCSTDNYLNKKEKLLKKKSFPNSIARIKEATRVKNEVITVLDEIGMYKRIPEKYCNAYAAAKMYDYFLTYRADNLKEAINLFELEEHQSRLEAKQDYIIKQNNQIQIDVLASRYAAELAACESQKAKSAASTASINSFLNLLKK